MGATVEDKTNSGVDANTYNVFELMNTIAPNAFPIYVSPGMLGGTSSFQFNKIQRLRAFFDRT